MKLNLRLVVVLVLIICMGVVHAVSAIVNLALLSMGGTCEWSGTGALVKGNSIEDAFSGDESTQTKFTMQNKYVNIDRIWDKEVIINQVGMKTTSAQRAPVYAFYYWDLEQNDWVLLVQNDENTSSYPNHVLENPIRTTKIRCWLYRPEGGTYIHIYHFFYMGTFVPNPISTTASKIEIIK